ncbi:MAG: BlaI/MecI/CopY family transcriptional regulator [Gaiellaceae bacterium]
MSSPPSMPPALHELESEVMEEMWRQREATVRDVLEALNRGPRQRAYTTIMTIMCRLWDKGLLSRKRCGRADVYRAILSREDYLQARAEAEVDAVVEEFGDLALSHFARQVEGLDPERLRRLRELTNDG